ncbi:MAG: HIT family protein [Candidatus Shapirobacteria bacterium]|nr:HIT family protein [Candidatus Shapirobacteria bacterium]
MEDCIFCKIVSGIIPCQKIAENDNFLAFLDIGPFTEGHSIIIPKIHYRWVYDVPKFDQYWSFILQVTQQIQKTLNPLFISYLTMGNQVPHAHVHLLPRYKDDCLTGLFSEKLRSNPTSIQLQLIADKINQ